MGGYGQDRGNNYKMKEKNLQVWELHKKNEEIRLIYLFFEDGELQEYKGEGNGRFTSKEKMVFILSPFLIDLPFSFPHVLLLS